MQNFGVQMRRFVIVIGLAALLLTPICMCLGVAYFGISAWINSDYSPLAGQEEDPNGIVVGDAQDGSEMPVAETDAPVIGGDQVEENPGGVPVGAGADIFALTVVEYPEGSGRYIVTKAGNRSNCAWSNTFSVDGVDAEEGELTATVPQCWEMHIVGTGTVTMTFTAGPNYNDSLTEDSDALAFWPYGHNATMRVIRNGKSSETVTLDANSPGIEFPNDETTFTVVFTLEDGVVTMPLGEVLNDVLPQY